MPVRLTMEEHRPMQGRRPVWMQAFLRTVATRVRVLEMRGLPRTQLRTTGAFRRRMLACRMEGSRVWKLPRRRDYRLRSVARSRLRTNGGPGPKRARGASATPLE